MSEVKKPKTEYEEHAGQEAEEQQTGQGDGKRQRRRGGGPSSILAPGEKPKDFRKAVGDTLRYMGGYKFAVAVVIVVSAVATVFETVGPKVMGRATTLLAEGVMNKIHGTGGIDFDAIWTILVITLGIYIASTFCQFLQGILFRSIQSITNSKTYQTANETSYSYSYPLVLIHRSLIYLINEPGEPREDEDHTPLEPHGVQFLDTKHPTTKVSHVRIQMVTPQILMRDDFGRYIFLNFNLMP